MGWRWGQSQVATALRSQDQGVSGDEGRSCALGQRPLVDSAAAAATQSPCPAAVATGVVCPGPSGEHSPAQDPGKVLTSKTWL